MDLVQQARFDFPIPWLPRSTTAAAKRLALIGQAQLGIAAYRRPKETLPLREKKIVPIRISLPHMYMKKYMHICIGYVVFGIYPTLFLDKPGWCKPGTKSLTKLPLFVLSARTASNLRNGGSTLASFSNAKQTATKKNDRWICKMWKKNRFWNCF